MKQSEITPEVIRLAKEIAEYWRMEIYVGCWIVWNNGAIDLVTDERSLEFLNKTKSRRSHFSPIPSISDVLGKLYNYYEYTKITTFQEKSITISCAHPLRKNDDGFYKEYKISLHESLLSALLEVLKEG